MKYFPPTSYNVVCQKKSYKLTKNLDTDDIDILIKTLKYMKFQFFKI
jgi:hypothetical protein